jgi:hypothetical protein
MASATSPTAKPAPAPALAPAPAPAPGPAPELITLVTQQIVVDGSCTVRYFTCDVAYAAAEDDDASPLRKALSSLVRQGKLVLCAYCDDDTPDADMCVLLQQTFEDDESKEDDGSDKEDEESAKDDEDKGAVREVKRSKKASRQLVTKLTPARVSAQSVNWLQLLTFVPEPECVVFLSYVLSM